MDLKTFFKTNDRARAFDAMRRGKSIPLGVTLRLLATGLFADPFVFLIRYMPGPVGFQLRVWLAKATLRHFGQSSLIDSGALIDGPANVFIGDYVWIDRNVHLNASFGEIRVGRRVHVAESALIQGGGGVYIGDYAAVAARAQLISHSEAIDGGKRLSGPMIVEEYKGMKSAPITLEKDSLVGAGAIVLPGVTIGEGALVAANSLVISNVAPWTIVMGVPARPVGRRPRVTVPDT